MLLHEMNYVYEVYRQRSFTKAAQALYIAQPSLSQMVRKAEARIGAWPRGPCRRCWCRSADSDTFSLHLIQIFPVHREVFPP